MAGSGFSVERLVTGPLDVNTYIIVSGRECLVVDPGDCSVAGLVSGLSCERLVVVVTHGHFDHVGGVGCTASALNGLVAAHPAAPAVARASAAVAEAWGLSVGYTGFSVDVALGEGSIVEVGRAAFRVFHTPGHSPDHIVMIEEGGSVALVGDMVFSGGVGRVDLPGSDPRAMRDSLTRLARILEGVARVLPGHGPELSGAEAAATARLYAGLL